MKNAKTVLPLPGEWSLRFRHPETGENLCIPARVPGNVETALIEAGLLTEDGCLAPDRLFPLAAFDTVDWTYECEFDAPAPPPGGELRLRFHGIDTVADVELNGEKLLHCENMFMEHVADITGAARRRGNRLRVHILPAALHVRKFPSPPFVAGFHPQQTYLRKPRHVWGWDNAPTLPTAGIWRGVELETVEAVRFEDVYWFTLSASPERAVVGVRWRFATPDADLSKYRLTIRMELDGETVYSREYPVWHTEGGQDQAVTLEHPALWWPSGYGDADLYDVCLELRRDGVPVANHREKFGVRELHLLRTEMTDPEGSGEFVFECNQHKIYIRGTNWKPLDALHSRAAKCLLPALELCRACHCNMIRIWGGGIYEDDEFFDYCDANGILVWQDFMFACELPARDDFFCDMVAAEAEWIVRKLRNHPSLALWCGDNEVDYAFFWGNFIAPTLLPSDNRISREVLSNAVKQFDPCRDYLESSPFVADAVAACRHERKPPLTLEANCPEHHIYPAAASIRECFRTSAAHFVSETGPFWINAMSESPEIVARELPRARRLWEIAPEECPYEGNRHQSDCYFVAWRDGVKRNLAEFFGGTVTPSPECPEELVRAVNLFVADTFKFAIEFFRIGKWRRTGVIWWSLLDMWPMMFNYSVVDYALRPKRPFHWITLSQQPLCLAYAEPGARPGALVALNDTLKDAEGSFRILRFEGAGRWAEVHSGAFRATANAVSELPEVSGVLQKPGFYLIHWRTADGTAGKNHFTTATMPFDFGEYGAWADAVEAFPV